jgi:hypothetical protein
LWATDRDRPNEIQLPLLGAAFAVDGEGDQLDDTMIMRDARQLFASSPMAANVI